MKRSLRRVVPVALAPALVAFAAPAGAQQQQAAAPSTCDVDQNKPGSLATAVFTITRMQTTTDTAAKFKALREVVGKVSGDQKAAKENPLGTAYTLAQAYSMLAQDVRLATVGTRADIGLQGTEPGNLLMLVDSTAKVIETAKPGCAENLSQVRQYAWLNTMNAALTSLNAQKMDSAAFYAERANAVYDKSPLGFYVMSTVAQQKGDTKTAQSYWPKIIAATENDTSQTAKELRTATMFNMAVTTAQEAEGLQGEAQKTKAKEAATAMQTFLKAYPQHPDAPRLQASLARVLTMSGDSTAVAGVYADMIANPAGHSDLALTQAGVIASQAGKHADAAKLFTAALEKSRYQRDALNNLSATYMQLKQYEPMLPIAQRLVEIDPANPDNYLFLAIAYQGVANATKVPAQKKAYTDSLLKYNRLANEMPVKVTFTEFSRGAEKSSLAMSVENMAKPAAAAPKAGAKPAAAAGPKTFPIRVEFLDEAGNVVDTQDVSVGPVAPGERAQARVEVAKPGVVAFRYKVQS